MVRYKLQMEIKNTLTNTQGAVRLLGNGRCEILFNWEVTWSCCYGSAFFITAFPTGSSDSMYVWYALPAALPSLHLTLRQCPRVGNGVCRKERIPKMERRNTWDSGRTRGVGFTATPRENPAR